MVHTTKRLLCLILMVILVLTLLPVMGLAADTRRLYCQAPESWELCYVHWWGGSNSTIWPGKLMTRGNNGIWSYDIPADATRVVFHNGSGAHTKDLSVPTDYKTQYVVENARWVVPGIVEPIIKNYYVAGDEALCGSDWNPSDMANRMTKDTDGTWVKVYEDVAAGSYCLKVTDGTWTNAWGGTGENGNYAFTVEAVSDVTVRFDAATNQVSVALGNTTGHLNSKLNIGHVAMLYAQVRSNKLVMDDELPVDPDLNGNGKTDIGDVARLYAHIRGTKLLS